MTIKRSHMCFIWAAVFACSMGYYMFRNWQWISHSAAIAGYIVLLLLLVSLGIVFLVREKREESASGEGPKLSNSGMWLGAAVVIALFGGYLVLMNWPHTDHVESLAVYAAVLFFLVIGLILRIREKKQRHDA